MLFDPPEVVGFCDDRSGELYQRDDDREETMRNRLEVYQRQTAPLASYYAAESLRRTVDGSGSIHDIQRKLIYMLGPG